MRKKIFKAIFYTALAMFLIGIGFSLYANYKINYQYNRDDLISFTHKLAEKINRNNQINLDLLAISTYRISIINPKGTVIYDNRVDYKTLGNHANRQEFKQALAMGSSLSNRYSSTLDSQNLYYALRLDNGKVLRVAISKGTLFSYLFPIIGITLALCLLLCVVTIFIAANLTYKILDPLRNLDLEHPLLNNIYDEINPLLTRIISQQQQIKEQFLTLKQQHNESNIITNSMKEGLIVLNRDFNILSINKSALKFYGTKDDFVGKSLLSLDRSEIMRNFFEHKDSNQNYKSVEISLNNRDLKYYFNQIILDGKIVGYAILIINVTAQNLAQKYRQEFTANVSHELKTPLQSIIGYAELIENNLVRPQDLQDFGLKIKKQGQSLLNLIEDIIFLSALDEGQTRFSCEYFCLNDLCKEVIESLEIPLNKKKINITLNGEKIYIRAIYRYFYELVYNLVDNAIKYNHENGSIAISLEKNDKHFVVQVKDHGIGIDKEHLDRIFERFYRVDKSHSKTTKGTGLGLSIVKRITIYYRGKVKVKSVKDEGSTFTCTFPIKNLVFDKVPNATLNSNE